MSEMTERPNGALVETQRPHSGTLAAPDPTQVIAQATREAKTLAPVIEDRKLYKTISGRKHVFVEGWTTLAVMRGCIPREVSTVRQDDGSYVSVSELVRLTDGTVLTRASAECGGPDEALWQNRAPHARRSMAQTRAAGKACRIAFSWVMVLAGYEGTPAEEMTEEGTGDGRKAKPKPSGKKNSDGATVDQRNRLHSFAGCPVFKAEIRAWCREMADNPDLTKSAAGAAIAKYGPKYDAWKTSQTPAEPPTDGDAGAHGYPEPIEDEGPPPNDDGRAQACQEPEVGDR